MTIKYRIYMEMTKPQESLDLLNRVLKNFTIFNGIGYWKQMSEDSTVIEYLGNELDLMCLKNVSTQLKKINKQETILLSNEPIQLEVI